MISETLIQNLLSLPAGDRARLATVLFDSVDDAEREDIASQWAQVARQRLDDYRRTGVAGVSFEHVHAELDLMIR